MIPNRRRTVRRVGIAILIGILSLGGFLMASMNSRGDLIPTGYPAPDFTASASGGQSVHLSEICAQKRVVLVFYPGDYSPVCTAQLCAIRDNWGSLQAENAVVYGVNTASVQKHSGFASKNSLPFPLLADTSGEIARAYGCRALFGIVKRTVYIIDMQGRVAWVKRGNPAPTEILEALRTLKDSPASPSASPPR